MANGSANTTEAANALASANAETVTLTAALVGSIDLLGGNDFLIIGNFASSLSLANVERVSGGTGSQTVVMTTALTGGVVSLGAGADSLNLGNFGSSVTVRDVETVLGGSGSQVVTFATVVTGGTISLGAGSDRVNFRDFASSATVSGVETITGGAGSQVVTLGALQSSGLIELGAGADTLNIGNFASTVSVENVETITAGTGNQTVRLRGAAESVNLGGGSDTLIVGVTMDLSGASLVGIETLSVEIGDTVTLSASQLDGMSIVGNGRVIVVIDDFDADLSDIAVAGSVTATIDTSADPAWTGDFGGAQVVLTGAGTLSGELGALATATAFNGSGTATLNVSNVVATSDLTVLTVSNVADFTAQINATGTVTFTGDFAGANVTITGGGVLKGSFAVLETVASIDGLGTAGVQVTAVKATSDLSVLNVDDVDRFEAFLSTTFIPSFTGNFGGADAVLTGSAPISATFAAWGTAASIRGSGTVPLTVTAVGAADDLTLLGISSVASLTAVLDPGVTEFTGDFGGAAAQVGDAVTMDFAVFQTAASVTGDADETILTLRQIEADTDVAALAIVDVLDVAVEQVLDGDFTFTGTFGDGDVTLLGSGTLITSFDTLLAAEDILGTAGNVIRITDLGVDDEVSALDISADLGIEATVDIGTGASLTGDFDGADILLTGTGVLTARLAEIEDLSSLDGGGTTELLITQIQDTTDLTVFDLDGFVAIGAEITLDGDATFTGDFGGADGFVAGSDTLTISLERLGTASSLDGQGDASLVITDLEADTVIDDLAVSNFVDVSAVLDLSSDLTFTGDFGGIDVLLLGAGVLHIDLGIAPTGTYDGEDATVRVTGVEGDSDLTAVAALIGGDLAFEAEIDTTGGVTFTGDLAEAAVELTGSGTLTGSFAALATAASFDGNDTASVTLTDMTATSDLASLNIVDVVAFNATLDTTGDVTFTGTLGGADLTLTGSGTLTISAARIAQASSVDGGGAARLLITDLSATSDLGGLEIDNFAEVTAVLDTGGATVTFTGDFGGFDVLMTSGGTLAGTYAAIATAASIDAAGGNVALTDLPADADLGFISGQVDLTGTVVLTADVEFTGDFNDADITFSGAGTFSGTRSRLSTAALLDFGNDADVILEVTAITGTSDLSTLNIANLVAGNLHATLGTGSGATVTLTTADFDAAEVTVTGEGTVTGDVAPFLTALSIDGSGTAALEITGLGATSDLGHITNFASFDAEIASGVTFTGDFGGADVSVTGADTLTGSITALGSAGSFDGNGTAHLTVTDLVGDSDLTDLGITDVADLDATLALGATTTFTGDFAGADVLISGAHTLVGSFDDLATAEAIDFDGVASLSVTGVGATDDLSLFVATVNLAAEVDTATAITFTGDFNGADVTLAGAGGFTVDFAIIDETGTFTADQGDVTITGVGAASDIAALGIANAGTLTAVVDLTGNVTYTADFDEASVILDGSATLTGSFAALVTAADYDGGGTATLRVTDLDADTLLTDLNAENLAGFEAVLNAVGTQTLTGNFADADVTITGTGTVVADEAIFETADSLNGSSTAHLRVTGVAADSDLTALGVDDFASFTAVVSTASDLTFTGDFAEAAVELTGSGTLTADAAVIDSAASIDGGGTASLIVTGVGSTTDLGDISPANLADFIARADTTGDLSLTGSVDFATADVELSGNGTLIGTFATLDTATAIDGGGTASVRVTGLGATSDITALAITDVADLSATIDTAGGVTFTGNFGGADVTLLDSGTLTGAFTVLGTADSLDGGTTASLAVTGLTGTSDLTTLAVSNVDDYTATLDTTGNVTFTGDFDEAEVTLSGTGTLTGTVADLATAGALETATAVILVTGLVADSDLTTLGVDAPDGDFRAELDITGGLTFTGDFDGADVAVSGANTLTGDFGVLETAEGIDGGTTSSLVVTDLNDSADLTLFTNFATIEATLDSADGINFTGDFNAADVTLTGTDTVAGVFSVLLTADTIDGSGTVTLEVSGGIGATTDLTQLNFSNLANLLAQVDLGSDLTFTGDFAGADVALDGSNTLVGSFDDLGTADSLDGGDTASVAVTGLTATSDLTTLGVTAVADFTATLALSSDTTFTGDFGGADVTVSGNQVLTATASDLGTSASLTDAGQVQLVITEIAADEDLTDLNLSGFDNVEVQLDVLGGFTFTGDFDGADVELSGTNTLTGDLAVLSTAAVLNGNTTVTIFATGLTGTSDLTTFNVSQPAGLIAGLDTGTGVTFTGDFDGADVVLTGDDTLTGSFTALATSAEIDGSGTASVLVTGLTATSDLTTLNTANLANLSATLDVGSAVVFVGDFAEADVALIGANEVSGTFAALQTAGSIDGGGTASVAVTSLTATSDLTTIGVQNVSGFTATLDVTGGVTFTGDFDGADVAVSGADTLTGAFADLATAGSLTGDTQAALVVTDLTATSDLSALEVDDFASFEAQIAVFSNLTFTGDFGGADVVTSGGSTLFGSLEDLVTADQIDANFQAVISVTGLTGTSDLTTLNLIDRADLDASIDTTDGVTFTGDFDGADVTLLEAGTLTGSFDDLSTADNLSGAQATLRVTDLTATSDLATLNVLSIGTLEAEISVAGGLTFTGDFSGADVTLTGAGVMSLDVAELLGADSFASQVASESGLLVTGLTAASDLSGVVVDRDGAGAVASYGGTLDVSGATSFTGNVADFDLTLTGSGVLTGSVTALGSARSITSSTAGVTLTGAGADFDFSHVDIGAGVLTAAFAAGVTFTGDLGETDALDVTAGGFEVAADLLAAAATANGSDAITVTGDLRLTIDADNEADDLSFIAQSGGTMTLVATGEVVFQGDVGDATRLEVLEDGVVTFAAAGLTGSGLTTIEGAGAVEAVLTFADNRQSFAGITNALDDAGDFRVIVATNVTINNADFDLGSVAEIEVLSGTTLTFTANRAAELSGSNIASITGAGNVTLTLAAAETIDLSGIDHDLTGTFQITGGSGANSIIGTLGVDRITGGGGIDSFRFTELAQSPTGSPDTITDFAAATEVLVFDGISGVTGATYLGAAAFTGTTPNEVRFDDGTDTLQVDVDGDGTADIEVILTGIADTDLTEANFEFLI